MATGEGTTGLDSGITWFWITFLLAMCPVSPPSSAVEQVSPCNTPCVKTLLKMEISKGDLKVKHQTELQK